MNAQSSRYPFIESNGFLYPYIPAILSHNGNSHFVRALIDTGATLSLIDGGIASLLDHNLRHKDVIRDNVNTASSPIRIYLHSFRVQILQNTSRTNVIWDSQEEMILQCAKEKNPFWIWWKSY